ncbi:zinc carboxypeptidase [Kutzneria sp. 744]|nr:zinc carboxypeptidase [Kutzneria sp. 744]
MAVAVAVVVTAALAACTTPAATPPTTTTPKTYDGKVLADVRHPAGASTLPSGRNDYREPADVRADLEQAAKARPDVVRVVDLPHKSVQGKAVPALEIAHHVQTDDGRPVFLLMGGIHANEWPGVEVATEFAMDLAEQDGRDPRITALLDHVRVIVVPVVNPDGFEASRTGRIPDKRKNCDPTCGTKVDPDTGADDAGVDLNRNFGVNWGGPGSSGDRTGGDYRGPKAFSEPETQNIRDLVTGHQVTVLVGLHTYGDMNLRPPGQNASPLTPDEAVYAELGNEMAEANGYPSHLSRELYETSGTAEEWSYFTTGGLGFETELNGDSNHGPFASSVLSQYAGEREALLRDAEAAANPKYHSRIAGNVPAGTKLELSKPGLRTTMTADGPFTWDVNPSIRPGPDGRNIEESWTLQCPGRTVQVTLARGETKQVSC